MSPVFTIPAEIGEVLASARTDFVHLYPEATYSDFCAWACWHSGLDLSSGQAIGSLFQSYDVIRDRELGR